MATRLIPIIVECHSGYKADEYPRYITRDNIRIEVREIVDRWYQRENSAGFPSADYFKTEVANGSQWLIKHELDDDKWYLVITTP